MGGLLGGGGGGNDTRPPDLSLANLDFLMCDQVEHEVCISE